MLNFLKRLKPDSEQVEDDSQYYSGEAYYQEQDQQYYAPMQPGYAPHNNGYVNQPQQYQSDQYHQVPGSGGQPQRPEHLQHGRGYNYSGYPGQFYNFAQPGMAPDAGQMSQAPQPQMAPGPMDQPQPAQPTQTVTQESQVEDTVPAAVPPTGTVEAQPPVAAVDPKLLQPTEEKDIPNDQLNSLDHEEKQAVLAETKSESEASEAPVAPAPDPNAGLTETNTVPADVQNDQPIADNPVNVADLKKLADEQAANRQPKEKKEIVAGEGAEDPLKKLISLVKGANAEINIKKLFIITKHKVSNEALKNVATVMRSSGYQEKDIVEFILELDRLVEDNELESDIFDYLENKKDGN